MQSASHSNSRSRIEFLTDVRTSTFPDEWYDANSEGHFWFEWRARAAGALIGRLGLPVDRPLRVLDIGCGTGIACRQLRRTTKWTFDGADLNVDALSRCDVGRGRILYYDILEKRQEFREQYDVAILFDVVEHVEKTHPFLDAAFFHLKPGGVLLVNVPALMGLYGAYDTMVGHFRRYTKRTLAEEFAPFNATILDHVYWGFSMVPFLWLRKQILRGQTDGARAIQVGFRPPSRTAHAILKGMMRLETAIVKRPPVGSSVMSAVRKNP
jgi:2-polyprenyl-3-methyl-5-hydroxy-6-metoxy-1,4-benzoquinol methylase